MRLPIVYLAGPIMGQSDEQCNGWRTEFKRLWGEHVLDPMRRDYRAVALDKSFAREIVENDKRDILAATGVVAYIPQPSAGTYMEILFAWSHGRAVITIVPEGVPVSPWVTYHSDRVVASVLEAADVAFDLLPTWRLGGQ